MKNSNGENKSFGEVFDTHFGTLPFSRNPNINPEDNNDFYFMVNMSFEDLRDYLYEYFEMIEGLTFKDQKEIFLRIKTYLIEKGKWRFQP